MSWFKKRKHQAPPTHMVVGLGNPGGEYKGTRHNIGFEAVEKLAKKYGKQLSKAQHRAFTCLIKVGDRSVLLVKPMTFMNRSGEAVAPLAASNRIPPENILVIADDMDLDLARIRMRANGSSGGHNGHKSIMHSLKTQDYPRIKIGIGKENSAISHVLSRFHPEERAELAKVLDRCIAGVEIWLQEGINAAMNATNQKETDQNE